MNLRALTMDGRRYSYADCTGISETQLLDFHSPYGCSKGAADQYVRDYARMYDLPTVVLRMSCIAGPRQFGNEDQGWVAHFLYSALKKAPVVIYGDGRQVRDVLCVYDLLHAFEALRAMENITKGQIYNIGGGPENTISLLELIDKIETLTGRRLQFHLDERRPGDQLIYVTDFSKLHRDTGWVPTYSISDTLHEIHSWWNRNRKLLIVHPPATEPISAPALQEIPGTAA